MSQFQKRINEGYEFNMGKYLDDGWAIFKKDAGSFIGFTLIFFIISFVIGIIPFVSFFSTFVQYALMAGAYIFIRNLLNNKHEFGDFFKGFNYFGQLFLYGLIMILFFIPLIALVFAFIFPFEMIPEIMSGTDPEWILEEMMYNIESGPMFFISILIVIAASLYIYVSYSLVIPLIADANLGFWQAMETSRKLVAKKFFHFLLFMILLGIIIGVAVVFTCGLGLLVAVPYGMAVQFSLYDHVAQPQHDEITNQVDAFGEDNRDINTESDEGDK